MVYSFVTIVTRDTILNASWPLIWWSAAFPIVTTYVLSYNLWFYVDNKIINKLEHVQHDIVLDCLMIFCCYLTGFGDICPRGYKCVEGSVEPAGCEPGTYQDQEGQSACTTCPNGMLSWVV